MPSANDSLFLSEPHDHHDCIEAALLEASRICRERGVRLTAQRRRVLQLVWASHRPIGAYAILERLRLEGLGSAPPTVYRALEFLMEQGLIHRIESRNAYTGCVRPAAEHTGQFLVCRLCGRVGELCDDRIARELTKNAARCGFQVERQSIELSGLCPHCQEGLHDS